MVGDWGKVMLRLRLWGLSAAIAAGLGGAVVAADPYMTPDQTTLVQKLFGPKPPKSSTAAPTTIIAPLTSEALSKAVQAESDALLRRVSVCDILRRIADEQGNTALYRKADELEREATTIYNARVTALGVPKLKTPLPDPAATRLPQTAEPRVAANRLLPPTDPIPSNSTAEVREVKP